MTQLKDILKLTYKKRQSANSSYSQNAFARDLGLSPTALSQFLSNKRALSPKNVARIVSSLGIPPGSIHTGGSAVPPALGASLELEVFSLIAEWQHFAILNLVEVDRVTSTDQITSRLAISEKLAADAVKRLLALRLLKRVGSQYIRTQQTLDAGTDIPSIALRKHNREKMELAVASLEAVPIEQRDIASLTLTFDPKTMAEVKVQIQRFKTKIQKLAKMGSPSEVYSMNVQFFPLSKREFSK